MPLLYNANADIDMIKTIPRKIKGWMCGLRGVGGKDDSGRPSMTKEDAERGEGRESNAELARNNAEFARN